MKGERHVGLRKPGVGPVVEHRLGPQPALLGGLRDHDQRTRPAILHPGEVVERPHPAGHVRVVPTGMHHRGLVALGRRRTRFRGKGQPRRLRHRQAVHVGADEQRRAGAVLHHRDDAGLADALSHGKARLARRLRHQFRRTLLLKSEFGVGVKVAIERGQRSYLRRRRVTHRLLRGNGGGEQRGERDQRTDHAGPSGRSASARLALPLPRRAGLGWLGSGAQPVRKTIWNRSVTRPSASARAANA